jgi:uncharacterized protein (TIGR03437 family)
LSPTEQNQMVAFLKALSDDRVRFERAPFDHPELCVAVGQATRADGNPAFPLSTADRWVSIPSVGRGGNSVPLQTFDELLAGVGVDGSRAHNLTEACGIEAVTATGFVNANAASFSPTLLAQSSIATAKGTAFTATTQVNSSVPVPTSLGGLTLNVTDSQGTTRAAPLFYVSPTQINYAIPEGTATGPATLKLAGSTGAFQSQVLISSTGPGLFGANGLAAANVLTVSKGTQAVSNVITADAAGNLSLIPIDLAAADQTYLILYGTGIRNHKDAVTAQIGSQTVPVDFAGAQGTYAGEDQINIALPASLRGAGVVDVRLIVDGESSNSVKVQIQ